MSTDTDGPSDADKAAGTESASSNVADDEEDELPDELDPDDGKPGRMSVYRKRDLIFFIFGLTFSTLAALYTSPKRISKTPPARPFFNQSSIVLDFYKGHLGAMVDRVTTSDFSFIMFYAPWDAECQAAREEFELVARYYHEEIFFAAINCWHPGSDCRTHYSKIQSYPVFMMYPSRDSGVQYRGILSAPYMIQFLSNFLNPIERIYSEHDLTQLLVKHDSVMLGMFNFNGLRYGPGYREFYKTAIRHLDKDPNRDTAFAVLTSTTSISLWNETHRFPSAALLMSNETLIYPSHKEWTTDNLLNWVSKPRPKPVLWLQPPGIKSMTMANFLLNGPVVFLFTPRNILLPDNYNFDLLKQVGLEYHNCDKNPIRSDVVSGLKSKIAQAEVDYKNRTRFCSELLSRDKLQEMPLINPSLQFWINDSCCSKVVINKCPICEKVDVNTPKVCTVDSKSMGQVCRGIDILYTPRNAKEQDKYDFCCSKQVETRTEEEKSRKLADEKVDPLSSKSIMLRHQKETCRKFLAGNEFLAPKFYGKETESDTSATLTESRCSSNRTMWFVAIDSVAYFHFADVFGMNVMTRPDKTAIIIVDRVQESQYILQKRLSRGSLVTFINDFVRGWLKRNLRSESSKSSYGRKVRQCKNLSEGQVCVPELTTKNFLSTVLDPSQDVVVFYHTPYCAFCSAVGYVFLTVAHYLRDMDHVKFVRIDGDNNDLPWEYTMNRYPSILFFPAKRKEDSTVFPFDLPVSIPNLVSFVLANLDGDSHVEALINICHVGAGESPRECLLRIRRLCLDLVQDLLRAHRKLRRQGAPVDRRFALERRRLLVQLEHVRDVHLILGSVEDLQKDLGQVALLRAKFRSYYAALNGIGCQVDKTRGQKATEKRHLVDEL